MTLKEEYNCKTGEIIYSYMKSPPSSHNQCGNLYGGTHTLMQEKEGLICKNE